MGNNDFMIGIIAAAGVAGVTYYLATQKKKEAEAIKTENIAGAGEPVTYGSVTFPSIDISPLDDKAIFRTLNDDGGMTSYKLPQESISSAQARALSYGLYNIEDDKLKFGIIPGIERKLGSSGSKAIAGAKAATALTAAIVMPAFSSLASATSKALNVTPSSLTPGKYTSIVSTPMANVTYKGTKTQIVVGKTIDKIKSLFKKY